MVVWRVVDVLAGSTISRVATQRSDFRSTLIDGGGPALMASLQRKVSDLSGAALLDRPRFPVHGDVRPAVGSEEAVGRAVRCLSP